MSGVWSKGRLHALRAAPPDRYRPAPDAERSPYAWDQYLTRLRSRSRRKRFSALRIEEGRGLLG